MKNAFIIYILSASLALPAQAASLVAEEHASAQCALASRTPAWRLIEDASSWRALSAEGPVPAFAAEPDWPHQAVLVFTNGARPSAGYSLALKTALLHTRTLILEIAEQAPPAGAMTAQVMTQPCLFLTLRKQAWIQLQLRTADTHARIGTIHRQP